MKAILYLAHGSRSKKAVNETLSFLQSIISKVDAPIQEICFLKLTDPSIEEGFKHCIEKGATEITVIPIFLLDAGHTKNDIPPILTQLQNKYQHVQITVKNAFGVQEVILDAIAELVEESVGELSSQDTILIVGTGGSDADIHDSFAKIAKGIQSRLGVENTSACYLAKAQPSFQESFETILKSKSNRIMVIPYLLFPGLLFSKVQQMINKEQKQGHNIILIGPLGMHNIMKEVVIQSSTEKENYVATDIRNK